jgi:hypothetical protein
MLGCLLGAAGKKHVVACQAGEISVASCDPMISVDRAAYIEVLANMAARLAGRDPDQHVCLRLGEFVAFDDLMWRYPDFVLRAEAAYEVLDGPPPA